MFAETSQDYSSVTFSAWIKLEESDLEGGENDVSVAHTRADTIFVKHALSETLTMYVCVLFLRVPCGALGQGKPRTIVSNRVPGCDSGPLRDGYSLYVNRFDTNDR